MKKSELRKIIREELLTEAGAFLAPTLANHLIKAKKLFVSDVISNLKANGISVTGTSLTDKPHDFSSDKIHIKYNGKEYTLRFSIKGNSYSLEGVGPQTGTFNDKGGRSRKFFLSGTALKKWLDKN